MATIHTACWKCGTKMEVQDSLRGQTVRCDICGSAVPVRGASALPDRIELETEDEPGRSSHEDLVARELAPGRPASPSLTTPAAPAAQPKDADKALTNVALGVLRLNGWPCREEPGYQSFTMTVKFKTPQRGVFATEDFHVYARQGVLYIEQLILELPSLPGVPVLETLNEINQRSLSSVFSLDDEGVTLRCALIPRSRDDGYFTARMMVHVMRQMFQDRRHALSLLRQVVESSGLDPLCVARTLAQPAAPNPIRSVTLDELADLAEFAGYFVFKEPRQILLHRELIQPQKCAVRIAPFPGFVRGWVNLGEIGSAKEPRALVPQFRKMLKGLNSAPTPPKPSDYLERLNELNRQPGLLRFVINQRSIVALAVTFPTDQPTTIEQFKVFAEALLHCSPQSVQLGQPEPKKLAG